MRTRSTLKTALLAAASLTAASAAMAHAADRAPMEPVAIEHAVMSVDAGEETAPAAISAKNVGFAAAATAALAGLFRLIGPRRLRAAAAATAAYAGRAASAAGEAGIAAAKAVAGFTSKPLKFAAMMAAIATVGLAGIGLYDVEWAGGLIIGAAGAGLAFAGASRLRRIAIRVKSTDRGNS